MSPRTIWARASEVPYDPSGGWRQTGQPLRGCGLGQEDYIELAEDGETLLQSKLGNFCQDLGKSHVVVPHKDFMNEYERGPLRFRPWFDGYCHRHGLNAKASIMIITGVKDLQSAERKSRFNTEQIDMHKDYARGMLVLLQGASYKPQHKINNLVETIGAVEEVSEAYNNMFAIPKKETKCRAHKGAWRVESIEGMPILASIKTQNEDQMDIDKLTRRFMGYHRDGLRGMERLWDTCTVFNTHADDKAASKKAWQINTQSEALTHLGGVLYDSYYDRQGYNALLHDSAIKDHAPLPGAMVSARIAHVMDMFGDFHRGELIKQIVSSGVLQPRLITSRGLNA